MKMIKYEPLHHMLNPSIRTRNNVPSVICRVPNFLEYHKCYIEKLEQDKESTIVGHGKEYTRAIKSNKRSKDPVSKFY